MKILAALLLVFTPAPAEQVIIPDIGPVWVGAPAERVGDAVQVTPTDPPPSPPVFSGEYLNGRCVGAEPLLSWFSPGWDVARMARIMYRESRCRPGVRSGAGATGLLQIMTMHCRWLDDVLGWCSIAALRDPAYNIEAAAALYRRQGMDAWAL